MVPLRPKALLLRLFAIAVLLTVAGLSPAAADPASNFADLKRLLAEPRVSSIEVKADIKLTEALPEVRRSIRITGQCTRGRPCVIDGDSKFRIFLFTGSVDCDRPSYLKINIVVSNLRLIKARANLYGVEGCGTLQWEDGAALSLVHVETAMVDGVTFEGNEAPVRSGGALAALFAAVDIKNCIFSKNRANLEGGAVALGYGGKATISSSTFSNNSATSAGGEGGGGGGGGAFFSEGGRFLQVIGCKFQDNTNALGSGGAVSIGRTNSRTAGGLHFQSNTFERNSAKEGGAVSVARMRVSFCNNVFANNVATGNGTAGRGSNNVLVVLDRDPAKFCPRVPQGARTICIRDYAGEVYSSDAPCAVNDQVRAGCGAGGACLPFGVDTRTATGRLVSFLLDENKTELTLTEHVALTEGLPDATPYKQGTVTIRGNCRGSAGGRCVIDGQGKFVTFIFAVPVVMENIEIRRAALTAVIANDGFKGTNLVFRQNKRPVSFSDSPKESPYTAGLSVSGNFTVSNTTFSDNSGHSGVAMAAFASQSLTKGVIYGCTFSNNVAARDGAGFDFFGEDLESSYLVEDSRFTGNRALSGPAISGDYGKLEVVRSSFRNNRATGEYSGAIRVDDYERFALCNCNFAGNTAKWRNSSNLFLSQITTTTAETLFCPSQPPLTIFNCNHNGEFDEPVPCDPVTIGGPACNQCR